MRSAFSDDRCMCRISACTVFSTTGSAWICDGHEPPHDPDYLQLFTVGEVERLAVKGVVGREFLSEQKLCVDGVFDVEEVARELAVRAEMWCLASRERSPADPWNQSSEVEVVRPEEVSAARNCHRNLIDTSERLGREILARLRHLVGMHGPQVTGLAVREILSAIRLVGRADNGDTRWLNPPNQIQENPGVSTLIWKHSTGCAARIDVGSVRGVEECVNGVVFEDPSKEMRVGDAPQFNRRPVDERIQHHLRLFVGIHQRG